MTAINWTCSADSGRLVWRAERVTWLTDITSGPLAGALIHRGSIGQIHRTASGLWQAQRWGSGLRWFDALRDAAGWIVEVGSESRRTAS